MHYYDPNDRRPRRWALLAAALYLLLLGGSFAFVSFDFSRPAPAVGQMMEIELTEPEEPPTPVKTAEVTQTPNPRALFKMSKGGVDEPDNAGNLQAPEGEDKASGTGRGLNPDGLDQLDKGLQGRGLVGALPKPSYPGSKSGKIVVRVTVDAAGRVTSAAYEPKGSTESDAALIDAALAAARKARFTESRAAVQGGTITYIFRME